MYMYVYPRKHMCMYTYNIRFALYKYLFWLIPQILPDVKLTIVHPDTKIPCAHTDLGEVGVLYVCVTEWSSRFL